MKIVKRLLVSSAITFVALSTNLSAAGAPAGKQMPAPKADVYIVPQASDFAITLKYPASIEPLSQAVVYSRVLGVLEEKHFNEGDKVKKGQELFTIEDDIYQAQVDAAQASLNMAEATLQNATRSWERIKKLYKSKAVTTEQRDTTLSTYQNALASVSAAKAQLKQAKINLNYTKVKAPISGVTGLKAVDLGNLVTSNPPMALVTITQNEKVYLEFSMPMSDYKNIKNGLWSIPENGKIEVDVILDGKSSGVKGYVDFIDVNTDENTSTVKMRAVVDNSQQKLMSGNFARVALSGIVQKNVITVPQKAVLQNPMGTIVMVDEGGKVGVRPIVPGKESGDKYIVAGGMVKSGDKVFVNNFFRIKPGNPVTVDKVINEQGK